MRVSWRVLTLSQHPPLPTLLSNLKETYWETCGFWTDAEAQNLTLYKLPLLGLGQVPNLVVSELAANDL